MHYVISAIVFIALVAVIVIFGPSLEESIDAFFDVD